MRKSLLALAALFAFSASANAQTCPTFSQGMVLTPGQWNACFASKQNVLGYTPVNRAGDVMQGRLVMFASSALQSGISLAPGTAPTTPTNGDIWTTAVGLYVRINGATVGPLVSSATVAITIGSTLVASGTSGRILYDNSGVAGEYAISGTGSVAMTIGPTFVTPTLGAAIGTSLALGGATLGGNALAVTGTSLLSGAVTMSAALTYGGVTLTNAVVGTGPMVLGTSPSISGLTVTSSFTATGLVTNADLANASTTVNGQTCTLGSSCTVTAAASSITYGTTTAGTSTGIPYNTTNGGTLSAAALAVSSVMVTSAGSVPSFSTTLPSGLTVPSPTLSGTVAGSVTLSGNNTYSGTALFTGALASTGSNGQASIGASSTAGAVIGGKGSSKDLTLANSAGTSVCDIATGGTTINCATLTLTNQLAGSQIVVAANTSGSPSATFGVVKCDGTTISCTSGTITAIGAAATSIAVGTTTISSGTNGSFLYSNSGVLGNVAAATQADQETATSTQAPVTPGRQQFHPSAAKMYAVCTNSAGTYTLRQSFNVSGGTCGKTATGQLTITLSTAFSSTTAYGCVAQVTDTFAPISAQNFTASTVGIFIVTSAIVAQDASFTVACFGDQ